MNFDLFFDDGSVAACETSLGKGLNRLHVQCANAWYGLEPGTFSGIQRYSGETSDGKLLNKSIPNEQARQMDDDALAILQNMPHLVPGEEGLKDIRVVEAIYRSVEEGEEGGDLTLNSLPSRHHFHQTTPP